MVSGKWVSLLPERYSSSSEVRHPISGGKWVNWLLLHHSLLSDLRHPWTIGCRSEAVKPTPSQLCSWQRYQFGREGGDLVAVELELLQVGEISDQR